MQRTARALAFACVAALCAATPALAQDPRIASRLDSRTAAEVSRVVESARASSLPTEPLVQKALQGSAKRAPSARVVAAVDELLAELSAARAALGARSSEAELVAGASALHAGIPAATLTRVRSVRGDQSATVALATLADLVARGVPVQPAVNSVVALVSRGAADAELLTFSVQVGRDIAAGAPPAVAARVRSTGGAAAAAAAGARPAAPPGRTGAKGRTIPRRPPSGRPPPGRP